jgi:hypothetical protein
MPVRRFRSAEELNQPTWREPGDPRLYRAIAALWRRGRSIFPRHFPPGVHRRRSIEEINAATEEWHRADLERLRKKPR